MSLGGQTTFTHTHTVCSCLPLSNSTRISSHTRHSLRLKSLDLNSGYADVSLIRGAFAFMQITVYLLCTQTSSGRRAQIGPRRFEVCL